MSYVVDGALKLDLEGNIPRVVDFLPKVKCDALAFLIVRDVLGRLVRIAGLQLSAVNLELMGIEHQLREAIVLSDLGVDFDGSLKAEVAAELNIVEGDSVVGGFGPVRTPVSLVRRGGSGATYHAGRMSLSDAISVKVLVTSL